MTKSAGMVMNTASAQTTRSFKPMERELSLICAPDSSNEKPLTCVILSYAEYFTTKSTSGLGGCQERKRAVETHDRLVEITGRVRRARRRMRNRREFINTAAGLAAGAFVSGRGPVRGAQATQAAAPVTRR